MDTENFSKVFETATKLLPQLTGRNTSAIWGWLNAGANADMDICPTIKLLAEKKPDIGGFSYFTNAILKAKQEREAAERAFSQEKAIHAPVSDARRAESIRAAIKYGVYIPHDRQWLREYEARV